MNDNLIKKSNCNSNILSNAINEIKKNKNRPKYVLAKSETITIGDTITVDSNTSARVIDKKVKDNHVLTFVIPKGKDGLDGENMPNKISAAYLVTFNENYLDDGYEIFEGERLPIQRKEIDTNNIIELDSNNNTIKFNKDGYYKISFNAYVRVPYFNGTYDPKIDFVTLAFRKVGTDNIYVGASNLYRNEETLSIRAEGILSIDNTDDLYELSNVSKRTIYLNTPDIRNINSNSYFTNSSLTLIIEYLGK